MKINIGASGDVYVASTDKSLLHLVKDDLIDIDDVTYKVQRKEFVIEEGELIAVNIIVHG